MRVFEAVLWELTPEFQRGAARAFMGTPRELLVNVPSRLRWLSQRVRAQLGVAAAC